MTKPGVGLRCLILNGLEIQLMPWCTPPTSRSTASATSPLHRTGCKSQTKKQGTGQHPTLQPTDTSNKCLPGCATWVCFKGVC